MLKESNARAQIHCILFGWMQVVAQMRTKLSCGADRNREGRRHSRSLVIPVYNSRQKRAQAFEVPMELHRITTNVQSVLYSELLRSKFFGFLLVSLKHLSVCRNFEEISNLISTNGVTLKSSRTRHINIKNNCGINSFLLNMWKPFCECKKKKRREERKKQSRKLYFT